MYLASRKAVTQDDNLVRPRRVMQHPHKILTMLVRYHHPLLRCGCSENDIESAIRR